MHKYLKELDKVMYSFTGLLVTQCGIHMHQKVMQRHRHHLLPTPINRRYWVTEPRHHCQ